ncbi:MAG TPA: DUF2970 domain-containing protein [Idiomarina baltica]|jgi:uncharacterized membrane protein|uniref:DUF2970 domain-containing protein n=2 Tax=Idiomarina baltica TaxID=190892 RepID=A0A348WLL5_9GAMM|nr:MAG: hypothetical protein AWU56_1338 [Idiomarina sp. T82-3]HAR55427.1 DUF2970 domain-containing protein [Idiomarina baltica]|tara:strand:- start:299 stop:511 length:213 start_codon:yes stop_codon:yes gene_type:complete
MQIARMSQGSILQTLLSVIAAFFGVQTDKNRQRDFNKKSPVPFIVVGIILAVLMVIGIMLIVKWVLATHS